MARASDAFKNNFSTIKYDLSRAALATYSLATLLIGMLSLGLSSCKSQDNINTQSAKASLHIQDTDKQRGAHLFRYRDTTNLSFLDNMNIEWLTLVPWGYMEGHQDSIVGHQRRNRPAAQVDSNWISTIQSFQAKGYKIFLKPHIWLHGTEPGKWRSDIFPKNEADWTTWKATYREFILRYARVAEAAGAEMYCVGTELTLLSKEKPQFWREIIAEIKEIYSGKLTYAANWYKEYEDISFWDELDYIGIQAYFPLVKKESPSTEELRAGWNKHLPTIKGKAEQYDKPILFTEMGYKSTSDSGITPWEWMDYEDNKKTYSVETQANCYQAFFDVIWNEPWFAGMHIWQLRGNHRYGDDYDNLDFTPQGKPATQVIRAGFGK
jgi:hypothetical protein